MTTNLLILIPDVPQDAIKVATGDTWGDTNRLNEIHNNRCGERHNLARLQTAKTGRTVISYDLGTAGAQTVDHFAMGRADLAVSDLTSSLVVRGSGASAFAPSDVSGLQLWMDPGKGVTTLGGAVSAWTDSSTNAYPTTQGTGANQPTSTTRSAGINSSRVVSFDGSNDRLLFTNTPTGVNLTGDFTLFSVFNISSLAASSAILGNENRDVNGYLYRILGSGLIQVLLNQAGTHPAVNSSSAISTGVTYIHSFVHSSGTGTHYINGTASGSGALANALTATGNQLYIGYDVSGATSSFSGKLGDVIVYKSALGTTDRQSVEAYLTAKYSTTPLVANYSFAANAGQCTEDYLSTFTTSSSYRYYWVEMDSSGSGKFTHSKMFLGQSVDMGDAIEDVTCVKGGTTDDDFISGSGAADLSKGKESVYRIRITWRGLTDAQIQDFLNRVAKNAATRPGVYICTTTNHEVLDGHKCIYAKLTSCFTPEQLKADYNVLTAEFEELPG